MGFFAHEFYSANFACVSFVFFSTGGSKSSTADVSASKPGGGVFSALASDVILQADNSTKSQHCRSDLDGFSEETSTNSSSTNRSNAGRLDQDYPSPSSTSNDFDDQREVSEEICAELSSALRSTSLTRHSDSGNSSDSGEASADKDVKKDENSKVMQDTETEKMSGGNVTGRSTDSVQLIDGSGDKAQQEANVASEAKKEMPVKKKKGSSGWRLEGEFVIHFDNIPKQHGQALKDLLVGFGTIRDEEKKSQKGSNSWRFM